MPVMLRCEVCEREYPVNPAQAARGRRFCGNRCRGVWIATSKTDDQRFWEKVEKSPEPDGCWLWTGHRMVSGYGALAKRQPGGLAWTYAHRRSWEMANGPIPEGKHILHACDNPPCVNPAHLSVGTQAENTADAAAKGRMRQGEEHRSARLKKKQVLELLTLFRVGGIGPTRLAAIYGVSRQTVSDILAGRTWKRLTGSV